MIGSMALIDFTKQDLLREAIFICRVIPGCFSYNDLSEMEFDDYESIYESARKINAG